MKNYFEGWYFKIVDKEEKNIYAIIPGISFGNEENIQVFIQFFDGINVYTETDYPGTFSFTNDITGNIPTNFTVVTSFKNSNSHCF